MKKKFGLLIIFIFIVLLNNNVYAWHGSSNYEVTKFEIKDDGKAYIEGWAILNGLSGYDDNGLGQNFVTFFDNRKNDRQSGEIVYDGDVGTSVTYGGRKRYLGTEWKNGYGNSIYGAYCNYGSMKYTKNGEVKGGNKNADYLYQYSLTLIGISEDKKEIAFYKSGEKYNNKVIVMNEKPPLVSLTYAQAYKGGSVAYAQIVNGGGGEGEYPYTTACYEDVGFKFSIDLANIPKNNAITGYKMRLTTHTGTKINCKSYCKEEMDLSIIYVNENSSASAVTEENTQFLLTKTYSNEVVNLMPNGYTWGTPGFYNSNTKSSTYAIQINEKFKVVDTGIYDNIRWYAIKVKNTKRWVPSSWVRPANEATILLYHEEEVEELKSCKATEVKTPQNAERNCVKQVTIKPKTTYGCADEDNTAFYTIKCSENIVSDFNNGDLTIKAGQGFAYNIGVNLTKNCSSTFDANKWKKTYEKFQQLKNNTNNEKDRAFYQTILDELESYAKNYNSWNYASKNTPQALITFNQKITRQGTFNFINQPSESKITKTNNNYVTLMGNLKVQTPFNYEEKKSYSLNLSKVYLDLTTGDVTTSEDHSIDGGNKIYTNFDVKPGNYTFNIQLKNLGDTKSSINNNGCVLTVVKSDNLAYRPIEITNPFVNKTRGIGNNWLNNQYGLDFTKVATGYSGKSYSIVLSSDDINKIRKSNSNYTGSNAYLGTCHKPLDTMDDGGKIICSKIK